MKKIYGYVTKVNWERIYLHIEVVMDESAILSDNISFYLVNMDYVVETKFLIIRHDDNIYEIVLNITNNGLNRCIDNGMYAILMVDGEQYYSEIGYQDNHKILETWEKCFRYNNNTGAYTVTFMLDEYSDNQELRLLFYNMVRRSMSHIDHLLLSDDSKQRLDFDFIQHFKNRNRRRYKKTYFCIWHHLYKLKRKKTVLFISEQDDKPALNIKCVYERMMEKGLDKKYEILQSYRCATSQDQSIWNNFKVLRFIAKADVIVIDDHVPTFDWLLLDPKVNVIQLWHAGAGFKGVGYSRWGHFGCPGPFSCHRQYTYCITGSRNISHFFSEQFGILDEQIIPTGMPRMDLFLADENRIEVTQKLYADIPQAKENKVILFAPTYRGQNRKEAYYPYDKIDFEKLYQYCNDHKVIVLFKMHPWVKDPIPIADKFKDRFFDMNHHPNINDLFFITDLLITDYSSCIYEFSLLEKPMLFYAYDKEQLSISRGFHRDYDSNVPGKVCKTFEEIMVALRNSEFDAEKSREYKKKHFDHVDTDNTDRVIDWLILGNLPKQYREAVNNKKKENQEIRGKSFAYLKKM